MNKILKIAQREYVETAKTKTFILGLVMLPFIIGLVIFMSSRSARTKTASRPPVTIAVDDLSRQIFAEAKNGPFYEYNKKNPTRQIQIHELPHSNDPNATQKDAKDKLRQGYLDAYVVLDENILENTGGIHLFTYKPKAGRLDILWTVENLFRTTVVNQRCRIRNLSPELLAGLRKVPIERIEVGDDEQGDRVQSSADREMKMIVPFIFMFLVYIGMVGTGQHLISSLIEEKSSRVIEVLLSAVSPFQLMAGKIVGLAGIGLTMVALWATAAYTAARWYGFNIEITGQQMLYFATYYILGILLFSSIFAGIGSICNTIKEAQGLMMPVMMLLVVTMVSCPRLVQNPDGSLARMLSFVPPLTPMVMILRLSADSNIHIVEIIASIALLAVTVLFAMWAAAKVFRTGILMYGKRPAMGELFRWIRQK